MKAVISNRIFIKESNIPNSADIRSQLTYKFEKKYGKVIAGKKPVEFVRTYRPAVGGILSIPQGRIDLLPEGCEILDKRVEVPMPFPKPKIPLRESQQLIVDQVNSSCFINALPGWGKTFAALHIAAKLGQKTLVVCHTTALRDQWIAEAESLFDMDIGIIGSGKFDIDPVIVVGNIQSIVKHITTLSKEFGTVILDEAHHCPATTFTNVIDTMYAKYRIGLSGTRIRADGRHVLFDDYFGKILFTPEKENTIDPVVKLVTPGITLPVGETWARKLNSLLYDEEYQLFISALVKQRVSAGHKVLVVSERVEFLKAVGDHLGTICAVVTSETSLDERRALEARLESGDIKVIAGSRQIFSEGISINILSSLVLPSPIANESLLEQLAGRVMRIHSDKDYAEIIDIQFSGRADKAQNRVRLGFYLKKGWSVEPYKF